MKEILPVILIAGVAFSSSALQRSTSYTLPQRQKTAAKVEMQSSPVKVRTNAETIIDEPTTAEVTVDKYAGEYLWTFESLLESGGTEATLTVTVTDAEKGEATIAGFCPEIPTATVKATIDLANNTFTIPNKQYIGNDSYGACYFYLKSFTSDYMDITDGATSAKATVGTIDGAIITFPEDTLWAVGDYNDEYSGWWHLSCMNVLECENLANTTDPNEGWHKYGTAVFVDGWMYPGFGIEDPSAYPINCDVQQNDSDENLLRLDNPYKAESSLFAQEAPSYLKGNGYIVFDVTDPEFVIVVAGINNGIGDGSSKFQNLNLEGYYTNLGATKEEVLEQVKDFQASTYKENVINVPLCGFDQNNAGKFYTWQDENGTSLKDIMKATVTITTEQTGINCIGSLENEDAPVYYNLQGTRISSAAVGQPTIMIKNGKATKIIK